MPNERKMKMASTSPFTLITSHFTSRLITIISITFLIISICLPTVVLADSCDVARDFAARAAQTFKSDHAEGLKLFHKALKLCDSDPRYKYNLGLAYYRYGNSREAEKYLSRAVKQDDGRAAWLNDLASVMLDNGSSPSQALRYAEKAWRLGKDDYKLGPLACETLARSKAATGDGTGALIEIASGKKRWPNDQALKKTATVIESKYLKSAVSLIKKGRTTEGLKKLKAAIYLSDLAAETWSLAMAGQNRGAEAMATIVGYKSSKPALYNKVWSQLVDFEIKRLYNDFMSGKEGAALSAAKEIHEKFPSDKKLKTAYNELSKAFNGEDVEIAKPEPAPPEPTTTAGFNPGKELGGLGGSDSGSKPIPNLVVGVDRNIPKGHLLRPEGIAVVIGNCHYVRHGKKIPDVKYAKRDADTMRKYLTETMGFKNDNILFYTDATLSSMVEVFGTDTATGRLYDYIRPGESEVFVYYTGHGSPGKKGKDAYLVPVDANMDYIELHGYPVSRLYDNLSRLPAKSLMVVLDACFSGNSEGGALFTNISPSMVRNISPVRELGKNSFVICGADKDQVCAWYPKMRHSLLTYYFFEGLQGKADTDKDKKITVAEMNNWLQREVPYRARRIASRKQTPQVRGNLKMVLAELK